MANEQKKNDQKGIWKRLLDGIQSAIHLQVITYIGDVEMTGEICAPKVAFPKSGKPHNAIVTSIDLVQGDITSCFPDAYTTDEQSWVRDYHIQQVRQGKEIVQGNLRLIADIGERLAKAIGELKKIEAG